MSSNDSVWTPPGDPGLLADLAGPVGPQLVGRVTEAMDSPLNACELVAVLECARRLTQWLEGVTLEAVGRAMNLPDAPGAELEWMYLEVSAALRMTKRVAGRWAATGETLVAGALPATRDALRRGEIGAGHAHAIAGNLRALPEKPRKQLDATLAEAASKTSPGNLSFMARAAAAAALPPERRAVPPSGGVHLRRPDGAESYLVAEMPEADLACILAGIDRYSARRGKEDHRPLALRRGDALLELATFSRDHEPLAPGGRIGVGVLVPLSTLQAAARPAPPPAPLGVPGASGSAAAPDGGAAQRASRAPGGVPPRDAPPAHPAGCAASLVDGAPITPGEAAELSCSGVVTWLSVADDGRLLGVGRSSRFPPKRLDMYVRVRDGRCQFPFCTEPTTRTTAHHAVHWAADGKTDRVNLVSLCRAHHRSVHAGGWSMVRGPDETTTWSAPNGRSYLVTPRALPGQDPTRPDVRTLPLAPASGGPAPTAAEPRRPGRAAQNRAKRPSRPRVSGAARRRRRPRLLGRRTSWHAQPQSKAAAPLPEEPPF